MNVPPSIGMVVSLGLATYAELSTAIGLEGLHDLMEIATVDAHNRAAIAREQERK